MTTKQIEILDQTISEMESEVRFEKQREQACSQSETKNNDSHIESISFAEYVSDLRG